MDGADGIEARRGQVIRGEKGEEERREQPFPKANEATFHRISLPFPPAPHQPPVLCSFLPL